MDELIIMTLLALRKRIAELERPVNDHAGNPIPI